MQSTSPGIDDRVLLGILAPLFVLPLIHPWGFVLAIALIPICYLAIYGIWHSEIFLMLTLVAPVLKSSPLNPIPPELDLTVIFYVLFLIATTILFFFKKRNIPRPEPIDLLLAIFVLIVIAEFFNAPGKVRDYSLFKLIRFLFLSLPFFFFPRIMNELDFRRLSHLIAIPGSAICLALFLVYPDSNVMKASGNSYLTVAAIAGIALLFAATHFVQETRISRKLFYLAAMTIDLVLVFKTNSRGGMLFGGMVLFLYFMIVFKDKRTLILFSLIFLTLATFFTYTLYPDFFTRFFRMFKQHKGSSIAGRFVVYKLALKLISQRWITGIGLGGFSDYHFLKYPHNLILEVFVEHGIAGFLAFMGFMLGIFSRGVAIFRRQALSSWFAPYLLSAIFMFLFQMTSFGLESTRLFFFFTGCLIAFYKMPAEINKKTPPEDSLLSDSSQSF